MRCRRPLPEKCGRFVGAASFRNVQHSLSTSRSIIFTVRDLIRTENRRRTDTFGGSRRIRSDRELLPKTRNSSSVERQGPRRVVAGATTTDVYR